jgi:hypothetical protein
MSADDKAMLAPQSAEQRPRRRVRRRVLVIGGVAMLLAIGLAVGLGVGLTVGRPTGSSSDNNSPSSPSATPVSGNATNIPTAVWKPTSGLSWQLVLRAPLTSTNNEGIDVWDIDVFDNPSTTMKALQDQGSKVVCYFSAGSYEDWRADKGDFQPSDLGNDLDGWPGEKWLNVNSPNVRKIMEARMDVAVSKGCDAIDPDNIDGYDNDNGLNLTEQDAVNYVTFLAQAAHDRNLAIGLKNAGVIIPDVLDVVQFSVNEQCQQYNECDTFRPFINENKPVFNVEYPKGDDTNNNVSIASSKFTSLCDNNDTKGFSTIIKNMNLDMWIEECPSSS